MNVWVRLTKRKSNCFYCGKEIETGKWQIICTYYMKSGSKMWTKRMLFHAEPKNCWLERAIAEISSRPILETRGRKNKSTNPIYHMNDPMKEARNKILRRRASVMQRLSVELEGEMRMSKVQHLTEMLDKLCNEIEPLGGVPIGWR